MRSLINVLTKKMRKSAGSYFCQANMRRFARISENAEQARYDIKEETKEKSL